MTGNESFDALANSMAIGTYAESAVALKKVAQTPVEERDHFARSLSEDDHVEVADRMLEVLSSRSAAEQQRLHVGDDFPAHVAWLMEGIMRLEIDAPEKAEATRKFIAACFRKRA